MARKLRIQYPGAIYHVMNRGDRREAIFEDDEDRRLFLETLGEAGEKTFEALRKAWCLGNEEFRRELLAHVNEAASSKHAGPEIREAADAKAEQIAREELARLGWTEVELRGYPKGHLHKVRIAARLRQETTMTLDWIANRLQRG